MRRLQALLDAALPPDLREHCRVGGLHDGVLVLVTDSPAWLSTLRYHNETLLNFFAERHTPPIRRLRWRVARRWADAAPAERPQARRARRSAEAAADLRRGAASMPDEGLRAALLRLADRLQPVRAD